jgi:C_GCAxxG_C_C family probable redox protein
VNESEAIKKARDYFLMPDYARACAETVLVVLQEAYDLPDPTDASAAMALNGGLAWRGGPCGALLGAAIAVGRLAERRIVGRRNAKRIACRLVDRCIDEFEVEYGSARCRDLIGRDIHAEEERRAFVQNGRWKVTCMEQVEFVVRHLLPLADEAYWKQAVAEVEDQGQ